MSQLVSQLKNEHKELAILLTNVQKLGVNSPESMDLLKKAKNLLLAHLTKEDNELYPKLKRASETDEDIKRKLSYLSKDMEEITKFVLTFFEKVENKKYAQLEFGQDFGKLITVLSNRINREESQLYPLYEGL